MNSKPLKIAPLLADTVNLDAEPEIDDIAPLLTSAVKSLTFKDPFKLAPLETDRSKLSAVN
jgi:hypothetical protein